MENHTENKKIIARIENLARQRKNILSLPPEKALNEILNSAQSTALVHSFSEEDFYFLIHDIGLEDSHPLLYLASDKQWEYIVDLEVWEKDRISLESVTRWFNLLFKVDPNRFIKWSIDQQTEFMRYYLFKNIELRFRETDQDPSDFGDEFFTFDDIFYIRFIDEPVEDTTEENESRKGDKKHRDTFLSKFFNTLSDYDHIAYQKLLLASCGVIPAEFEEETYRLRNVRLAEKGFLPYEDAIGIYQPMKPAGFKRQSKKIRVKDPGQKLFYPVPLYHAGVLGEENHFTIALKRIKTDEALEQIQTEFAGLCNEIISADRKTIRNKKELKGIVKKACGYLSIGLDKLAGRDGRVDADRSASLIQDYPLSSIFRVGFGLALDLKWRAERWLKKSWFDRKGLLLGFWGEEGMGVLGGLLLKKPLFYDNYTTGELYREFFSRKDLEETENTLNEIIAFDDLLSLVSIEPDPEENGFLTYKSFLLTLWARHYLKLPERLLPLTPNEFKRFFSDLWADNGRPRKTSHLMKELFLDWLSRKTGLKNYEISQKLGRSLEQLFNEIEIEYGKISVEDLDPRHVHLFLVKLKKGDQQDG